ncbi:MAG: phospholipase D-like domain-containing protein [Planctomycetota bacterium]
MNLDDLDGILARTLDDRKLSRSERRALQQIFEDLDPDAREVSVIRSRAFDLARDELKSASSREVFDWLEDLVKVLSNLGQASPSTRVAGSAAFFSPGRDCVEAIRRFVQSARKSLDVCVFTITDNRISDEILDADRRGVQVRVVTDDDKAEDLGSDVEHLIRSGIQVRIDETDKHMHHKFAVADAETVLTGSYNWTRSAATVNEENVVILSDPSIVKAFRGEFDKLWKKFT